jgi:hypothetical protein
MSGRMGSPYKKFLAGLMLLLVLCAGCSGEKAGHMVDGSGENALGEGEKAGETPPLPAGEGEVLVLYRVYSETVRDPEDGTLLLEAKITVPQLENPENMEGIAAINRYYEEFAKEFMAYAVGKGRLGAQEERDSAREAGFDFHTHRYESAAEIYYNGNNLLSVLRTDFEFTGGAHPMHYRSAATFDITTGEKLGLADILGGSTEEALERVFDLVQAQIEEREGSSGFYYNESYREDLRAYYGEEDFYLTGDGLAFYYQLYALAPYAAGFPEFKMPYAGASPLAREIPPQEDREGERELHRRVRELLDRNKVTFYEIYGLSMLPMHIPQSVIGEETLFPVVDHRFETFPQLEEFIRDTYVQKTADALLGDGRYQDVDGRLYGDISKDAGGGYYVNWEDYRYCLEQVSDDEAVVHVFTIDDSPAGREEITLTARMLKERGRWLLENVMF